MEYKILSYFGETFYCSNKNELFDFLDQITLSSLGDSFDLSRERGYFISHYEERDIHYSDDIISTVLLPVYVKCFYIVQDKNRYTVNYQKLIKEYYQSRNLYQKQKKHWWERSYEMMLHRSTKKYRRRVGKNYVESKRNCHKEYAETLGLMNEYPEVKIRNKRFTDLRLGHVFYYCDEYCIRKSTKSWKHKKVRKQWQKNIK